VALDREGDLTVTNANHPPSAGNGAYPLTLPPRVHPAEPDDPPSLPCERMGPDLWFAEQPHDAELAKRHCQTCPVRQRCLAGALGRAEPWGVWGGEILIKGTVVPTKRGRGRPPRVRPATHARGNLTAGPA
jgi:WhiB family redox-sensing transcriptional regulator